tara:strand:+ start:1306 stop:2007 length:702 start_codon:yes stop_codon:yes gene_type:complete
MATEQPEMPPAAPPAAAEPPANGVLSAEEQSLQAERAYLQHHNQQLHNQLAQLQQQHGQLTQQRVAAQHQHAAAAAAAQQQHAQHYQQPQPAAAPARPAAAAPHNPQWTEQTNPDNGQVYYWNSVTGESTWTRPADYNPGAGGAAGPGQKGPPGANLFIVRKMRRGEYDEFNDSDLRSEFGKFGTVTRAEMTMDKETGWSKGAFACAPRRTPTNRLRPGLGMAHDEEPTAMSD